MLPSIFLGRQVRKQAAVTLRCMQALVRVQARVRANCIQTSLEGQSLKNCVSENEDQADMIKQAEVYCAVIFSQISCIDSELKTLVNFHVCAVNCRMGGVTVVVQWKK